MDSLFGNCQSLKRILFTSLGTLPITASISYLRSQSWPHTVTGSLPSEAALPSLRQFCKCVASSRGKSKAGVQKLFSWWEHHYPALKMRQEKNVPLNDKNWHISFYICIKNWEEQQALWASEQISFYYSDNADFGAGFTEIIIINNPLMFFFLWGESLYWNNNCKINKSPSG